MLYFLLRPVVQFALRIFFKKLQVQGRENLHTNSATIYVANHPNTFMDPLIVAALSKKNVHFLANGSVFNRFTRPIFRFLNMIPIYRKVDKADKPLSQAELNKMSFQQCFDFLKKGGTLLIFPEGTSVIERKLREIKTGTARIALGAEYENNFQLGLQIVPIGLNYDDADKFRSEVFVKIGKAISLQEYANRYQPDNFELVEQLTATIEQNLSELIIITENPEQDKFLRNLEILYKNRLFQKFQIQKTKETEFVLLKEIIKAVKSIEKDKPHYFDTLKIQTENYLENLRNLGISDYIFQETRSKNIFSYLLKNVLFFILGFPLYVLGLVCNYIPYILPSKIARAITKDIAFKAPIMMISGIFTFSLHYLLMAYLIWQFGRSEWYVLGFFIFSPVLGYFVMIYFAYWKRFRANLQAIRLFYRKPSLLYHLIDQRKEIFKALDEAKNLYLEKYQNK
jgi:1-acyl-sn-glycerol-3-phosphate acyltransferase